MADDVVKTKKKKKTKMLLGCIDVPLSSAEDSGGSQTEPDDNINKKKKKKEKRLKEIHDRGERKKKEKKEKKKNKNKHCDEEEATAKKKKKKEKRKKEKKSQHDADSGDKQLSADGNASVVVWEMPLQQEQEGSPDRKRKMVNVDEEGKKKPKLNDEDVSVPVDIPAHSDTASTSKPKKKKKDRRESAELSDSFLFEKSTNNPKDGSVTSNNVSCLMSPSSKPECNPRTEATSSSPGPTPVPMERKKKKKKKEETSCVDKIETLRELTQQQLSKEETVETPTKGAKKNVMAELKEKVKSRKLDSSMVKSTEEEKPSTPTPQPAPPSNPAMGQWGNVELGSNEKTQKFFRLLGGMKRPNSSPLSFKGPKGSSSVDSSDTAPEKAIMAMGKKDADTLNRKLEEQFKKALGGFGRGKVGLGFSPAQETIDPSQKKFHIDATSSKSVKF